MGGGTLKRRMSLPSILQQPELAELWDLEGRWDPNRRQRGGRCAPDPVHPGVSALLPSEGRGPPCTHLPAALPRWQDRVLPGGLDKLALPPFPRRPLQHCSPPSSTEPAFRASRIAPHAGKAGSSARPDGALRLHKLRERAFVSHRSFRTRASG